VRTVSIAGSTAARRPGRESPGQESPGQGSPGQVSPGRAGRSFVASDAGLLRDGGWGKALCRALAEPPAGIEAWLESHTRLIKEDRGGRVGLLQLREDTCCLKFYRSSPGVRAFALRLGIGRGVRSFDRALALAAAGVRVPEPRACLRVPGGMLLLTEGLPASKDLRALWTAGTGVASWAELMGAAGLALAGLHAAGFAHGDCKWSNLLWGGGEICFVDLESVRRARAGDARCLRDLARFTLDAEELALPAALYRAFIGSYAMAAQQRPENLARSIVPPLDRLRGRHLAKYGPRGHRLL
jgi:tRNA A-37 threonylcarbamoyl transferase component Bud32